MTLGTLADVRRTGVDRDHQLRAGLCKVLERIGRVVQFVVVPAVLADQESHRPAADVRDRGMAAAGLEVPALIEDVVGWQQLLVIGEQHLAATDQRQRIAQRLARLRDGSPAPRRDGRQCRDTASTRSSALCWRSMNRLEQQILG
jgi:hypothetical protein